jgi:hypothetical protein
MDFLKLNLTENKKNINIKERFVPTPNVFELTETAFANLVVAGVKYR